jgi:hypothetical protein
MLGINNRQNGRCKSFFERHNVLKLSLAILCQETYTTSLRVLSQGHVEALQSLVQ